MKRILFVPYTMKGGCYYYRAYTPMKMLAEKYPDEFKIDLTLAGGFNFNDDEKDDIGKNYDIVWIHQCLFDAKTQDEVWKMIVHCREKYGTKFILDLDDYWNYGPKHPFNQMCQFNAYPIKMMINLKLFDYITTTTEYFKAVISQFVSKEKIFVFENAISLEDSQFSMEKNQSERIRLGITGGSSHTEDIKELLEFPKFMNDRQIEQIELVFCGYEKDNAKIKKIDEQGNVIEEKKIDENDNWWYKTENILNKRLPYYKRVESKSILNGDFGKIYKDIDILLVPLLNSKFNRCKSELKFIEAGFTNTAVISSNVIPYNNFGENEYDCLFVKENTPESWAKTIKKILRDKDYVKIMAERLNSKVTKTRNLEDITNKRAEFLKNI